MLFQPVLIGSVPYVARVSGVVSAFPTHLHHEIELMYCLDGSFDAEVNGQKFTVSAGQLLFVGSMQPHAYYEGGEHERLIIELGPLFMREHFSLLASCRTDTPVIDCVGGIRAVLDETAALCRENSAGQSGAAELAIIGNIYKLGAWLLQTTAGHSHASPSRQAPHIERALLLVHQHYNEPLTVEDAARETGYGKSNFCKLFRRSVGMSFHAYLNAFRIRNAQYLLTSTSASVEEIGARVGFCDTKTFCRVFREMSGTTPGKFRAGKYD